MCGIHVCLLLYGVCAVCMSVCMCGVVWRMLCMCAWCCVVYVCVVLYGVVCA